jgi:hypothetical protein
MEKLLEPATLRLVTRSVALPHARIAVFFQSSEKGVESAALFPSIIQVQREAFSSFSMRNRGILEKEPGSNQSDREQRSYMGAIYS